jgi:hypothetical protein
MGRAMVLALWLTLALAARLPGVPVKVISLDHRSGRISLLLPAHHTRIDAMLAPEENEIRLRVNEFYDAEFESGEIDTVKRNVLKVAIPGEKPVRFRLRRILFLSD